LAKVVIVTVALSSLLSGGMLMALSGAPGPGGGADYGLDTDGDGAYDWLVVRMSLSVDAADWYNVWATLGTDTAYGRECSFGGVPMLGEPGIREGGRPNGKHDGTSSDAMVYGISWASARQFLEPGDHDISLAFKGTEIGYAAVDGPYTVQAQVYRDGEWDSRIMGGQFGAPMPGPSGWDWTYVTKAYRADDFEEPTFAIRFTGEASDRGLDLDDDGLFDYLVVEAQADVALAGTYSIGGALMIQEGEWMVTWVAGAWGSVDLAEGRQTVEVRFNGGDVWASGASGAFDFNVNAYYGGDMGWGNITPIREGEPYPPQTDAFDIYGDYLCGKTEAYRHEQFEERVEPAKYTGVFADFGEDLDGDGLFDALIVQAEVEVTETNLFDFSGQLLSQDGSAWISGAFDQVYLEVGAHTLSLRFPGGDIARAGIDGPYRVDLNLVVANRDPATTIYTAAYHAADFEVDDGTQVGGVWIQDLTADGTTIGVVVARGPDMLTVVAEGSLVVTVYDGQRNIVFEAKEPVSLPSGGDIQSFTFAWAPGPGTYYLIATVDTNLGGSSLEIVVQL
jgi:hypothetical protein